MTQKQKYDAMMILAKECENRSVNDMHISTMCCIAENTAIIADALSSRQQDSDAVHLAKRICEIAKKNTDGDIAMTEIAYLLQDKTEELYHAVDFKQYFENRRKKTS